MISRYLAVFNDGAEVLVQCKSEDDLWIALAEQYPNDDPTRWIEYVEDSEGNMVEY